MGMWQSVLSVRIRGNEHVEVVTAEAPEPGPAQVVVRVAASGICGSDLIGWYWRDHDELARLGRADLTPGHEAAGTVVAVGAAVTSVSVGDRVVIWSHCAGQCERCGHIAMGGLFCADAGATPRSRPAHGGQAELVLAESWQCMALPAELSFEAGSVLACAGGTAYQAAHTLGIAAGQTVLVLGAGALGLQVAQVALLLGARPIVVDPLRHRLEQASALGAVEVIEGDPRQLLRATRELTGGFGADVVVEAAGTREAQRASLDLARVGGCVGLLGIAADGIDAAVLRPGTIVTRQLTVIGTFVYPPTRFAEIAAFAVQTGWQPDAIVTDRVPFGEAERAYRVASERTTGKVVLVPAG